jgi:CubicO group peptidase (beta-lactamase class C family)
MLSRRGLASSVRRGLATGLLALAACGGDGASFDGAFAAAATIPNLTSLAISGGGAPAREQYAGGTGPQTPHDVRSVTKSVTALLVLAAIDTGCLTSLDETLGEALGPLAPGDPAKAAITLRDLLTMSSGLDWHELGAAGYDQWAAAPDQVAYVLAQPLVATPGTVWNYDSGAFHLLSVALTESCGGTAAFAQEHLFGPLGIAAPQWETDSQGFDNGAAGVQLSTQDLLAIAALVLNRGAVGSQQLVPAAAIDAATGPQLATGGGAGTVTSEYGYGWWVGETAKGRRYALAEGYGGQFILLVPEVELAAVVTSNWQGIGETAADAQFAQILALFDDQVLEGL